MNADYVRRIAVWLIQEGWTTNARRDGFPLPPRVRQQRTLTPTLSFGLRPVRAQGRRSALRLPALFAWFGGDCRYRFTLALPSLWAVCKREALPNSRESFFERARSASGASQGKGEESEEGRKPAAFDAGCRPSLVLRIASARRADHKSKNQL